MEITVYQIRAHAVESHITLQRTVSQQTGVLCASYKLHAALRPVAQEHERILDKQGTYLLFRLRRQLHKDIEAVLGLYHDVRQAIVLRGNMSVHIEAEL